jgi:hypothetical protein
MSLLYSAVAADAVGWLPAGGATSRALIAIGVALVVGGASILLLIRSDDHGESPAPPNRSAGPNRWQNGGAAFPSPRRRSNSNTAGRHAAR